MKYEIDYIDAVDAAYAADRDEDDVRVYSGRGMFGDECLGFVCNQIGEAFIFADEIAQARNIDLRDFAHSTAMDNMAMDIIVYWPNLTLVGKPETE